MKNKILLDPKNAIRIDYWANNRMLYVFKCAKDSCQNEIRVGRAPSQLRRSTGICTSCHQKKKPFGILFNRILQNAKKKKIPISLTYEQFLAFTKIEKCFYCKSQIEWQDHASSDKASSSGYNIDRKDSEKGYSKENCVVCCKICNWSKNNLFTHEEFIEIGKAIKLVLSRR